MTIRADRRRFSSFLHGLMTEIALVLKIAHLTWTEARRRKLLAAALLLGLAFLAVFGTGLFFMHREMVAEGMPWHALAVLNMAAVAGLYAANFLVVVTSILLVVETLAGEIGSGVIETLCAKPVYRRTIVLGKWLGCELIVALYVLLVCGGVVGIAWLVTGRALPGLDFGLPLILLEGSLLAALTLMIASRLPALSTGLVVAGLHGVAFVAGWVEQIGTLLGNGTARAIGIVASLVIPSEALWRLASYHMQPSLVRDLHMTPFSPASVPSPAMVVWSVGYLFLALIVATRLFAKRDL
jgi:ABC-type transport system involved in multi-copper enzyme maturation permease subunit